MYSTRKIKIQTILCILSNNIIHVTANFIRTPKLTGTPFFARFTNFLTAANRVILLTMKWPLGAK